jgi:hypothetical protein
VRRPRTASFSVPPAVLYQHSFHPDQFRHFIMVIIRSAALISSGFGFLASANPLIARSTWSDYTGTPVSPTEGTCPPPPPGVTSTITITAPGPPPPPGSTLTVTDVTTLTGQCPSPPPPPPGTTYTVTDYTTLTGNCPTPPPPTLPPPPPPGTIT